MSLTATPPVANPPQVGNSLKLILGVTAAIADFSGVSIFLAQYLRQDPFFLFGIAISGILFLVGMQQCISRGWIYRPSFAVLTVVVIASILFAITACGMFAGLKVKPFKVTVTDPKAGEMVDGYRYLAKGHVEDPDAKVTVVVRATENLEYWVQESPTMDAEGNWEVNVYLGEPRAGAGEAFEITAFATNENFLVTKLSGNSPSVGKLTSLPSNTNRSNTVVVKRRS